MAMRIERGAKRTSRPDIFLSHSSRDKDAASKLAKNLNFCGIDVWLDEWELQVGQSLTDEISKAMNESRYVAILITENYNKTIWTKTEYKKALAREQKEQRTVMLPLIVGEADIPDFLEDKIYIDLRQDYFSGIVRLAGMLHDLPPDRINPALSEIQPDCVGGVWRVFDSINFQPTIVLGKDDFDELIHHGGTLDQDGCTRFDPNEVLQSPDVSEHFKSLIRQMTASDRPSPDDAGSSKSHGAKAS